LLVPPDPISIARVVAAALAEDLAAGDPTSEGLFVPGELGTMSLLLKEPGVVCGLPVLSAVFAALDPAVIVRPLAHEGEYVAVVPAEIARLSGPVRALLAGERTALNLLGRLSGVATLTARCVAELEGSSTILLDTRKTTPGLRTLEKYAVRAGGGANHRLHLGEALLLKDNHLRLAGGIKTAIARLAAAAPTRPLEVEAETQQEVAQALASGSVTRILLDNMSLEELTAAMAAVAVHNAQITQIAQVVGGEGRLPHRVTTEASGGISLANLRAVGGTGVDFVSLGALTHSARALDVSLEVVL
jgi:nicotinate-nucleotide pyrophosphorylase (carboxylating)